MPALGWKEVVGAYITACVWAGCGLRAVVRTEMKGKGEAWTECPKVMERAWGQPNEGKSRDPD